LALCRRGVHKIRGTSFPEGQIIVLKDAHATKTRILDQFINLHKKAHHRDDRVLFFFAGHGLTFPGNSGPIGYLVPADGDPSNLNSLIRWDDITRNAELIPAKHILFIMDACYSGLAIRRTLTPGVQRFISDLLQRPARQVITAGKADQSVADGGGPSGKNSLFTGYLLEGINGSASNPEGVLTANSLMSYLHNKVGQDPRSQQTPHYGHIEGDGDFVLLTPGQEHLIPELAGDYLVEVQQEFPEVETKVESLIATARQSFALLRGYGNPKHANFGRNELSAKLGEYRVNQDRDVERALSWLGVVIEPLVNQSIDFDIARMATGSKTFYVEGSEPYEKFMFPLNHRTTVDSFLMYSDNNVEGYWNRYLRIEQTGSIEYGDTRNTFIEFQGKRMFYFLQMMGITWQLLFLAKQMLLQAGYRATVRVTFSLVGTRDSILAGFSQEEGTGRNRWREPKLDSFGLGHIDDRAKCADTNLKVEHELALNRLSYDESLKVIKSIAQRIELAYNHHESPRCFNYGTDSFPWRPYLNDMRC